MRSASSAVSRTRFASFEPGQRISRLLPGSGVSSWSAGGRLRPGGVRLVVHERVAVVLRRRERLLDRARADPPDEVPHRAGLVVRARGARAAEGLLPDDGAGRLVVDVEVPRRVTEPLARDVDG